VFEWFYNNRVLTATPRHQLGRTLDGVYTLNISGVVTTDAGVYKCVVSNQGGEVTCIAHLRVGCKCLCLDVGAGGGGRVKLG